MCLNSNPQRSELRRRGTGLPSLTTPAVLRMVHSLTRHLRQCVWCIVNQTVTMEKQMVHQRDISNTKSLISYNLHHFSCYCSSWRNNALRIEQLNLLRAISDHQTWTWATLTGKRWERQVLLSTQAKHSEVNHRNIPALRFTRITNDSLTSWGLSKLHTRLHRDLQYNCIGLQFNDSCQKWRQS